MGAVVGKVMPRPMGAYDKTTTYDILDMVTYNDALWMCKEPNTVGIEPNEANSSKWQLLIKSSVADALYLDGHEASYFATADSVTSITQDVANITNGTTPVGNANTLGGNETITVPQGGTGLNEVGSYNFVVGNGIEAMIQLTPAEVLELINATSVQTLSMEEFENLEEPSTTIIYNVSDDTSSEDQTTQLENMQEQIDEISEKFIDGTASQTANTILASPNGSAGVPLFRALVSNDIPKLSTDKLTSGTLPTGRGGTGITSNPSMLVNLASTSATSVFATSPKPGVTGTLGVANGGTGFTTLADTTYTTARYRGSALYTTATNPTVNGVINWIYE